MSNATQVSADTLPGPQSAGSSAFFFPPRSQRRTSFFDGMMISADHVTRIMYMYHMHLLMDQHLGQYVFAFFPEKTDILVRSSFWVALSYFFFRFHFEYLSCEIRFRQHSVHKECCR